MDWQTIVYALLGGVVPALLWLAFWLQEDSLHPEPKSVIIDTFSLGMVMAALALLIENIVKPILPAGSIALMVTWVTIEEGLKFLAAYTIALRSQFNDEPIDAMIYLITAALGFAAAENSLYIIGPLLDGNLVDSIATGNLRFMGSTVLHTVTSGVIGIMAAYSFRKHLAIKDMYLIVGLILAIFLHTAFNLTILKGNEWVLTAFGSAWLGAVMLIVIFERVKKRTSKQNITSQEVNPQ